MKTRLLTFVMGVELVLGAMAPVVRAQTRVEPTQGPRIEFATPVFDFGKVKSGDLVKHSFVFTNTGTATLQINEVRPGCGCTAAGQWDKEVAPGKTGSIPIQFNSTGFGGPIAKSVTVTCNDPARSNIVLQIKGTAWKPIEVTPTMAYFTVPMEAPTNQTKSIRIVSHLDEPLKLTPPESTNRNFQVELVTVTADKEYELRVTAVGPYTSRYVQSALNLKTSAKEMPVIAVHAYASVMDTVTVAPSQMVLPPGPLTNSFRSIVTVRNSGTNALSLADSSVEIPGAKVKVQNIEAGRVFTVQVEFPDGYQLTNGQRAELKLKTSHPQYPLLTVPILQRQVSAFSRPNPVTVPAVPLTPTARPPAGLPPTPVTK